MSIPDRIPIAKIPNYFTEHIGTYEDGKQFMSSVQAQQERVATDSDWRKRRKWYAILHKFDQHGNYLDTLSWYAGTSAQGQEKVVEAAKVKLDELIHTLTDVKFQDISVKLFEVKIDGHTFALRQMTDDDYPEGGYEPNDLELVVMKPSGFVFSAPWDGHYDT